MASTTTNMGLTVWDQTTDFFVHTDLRNNWDAVDAHDHSPGKGAPITSAGLSVGSVTTPKLLDLAVTTSKLDNAAVTDAKLDRTAVAQYRKVVERAIVFSGTWGVNTKYIATPGASLTTGAGSIEGAAGTWLGAFYLNPADFYLGSYTTPTGYYQGAHAPRFKIQANYFTNDVAPTASTNITVDLRAGVTASTASGNNAPGIVTTTSLSTVTLAVPASTNARGTGQSAADFSIPSADFLCFECSNAAASTLNSQIGIQIILQATNV